MGLVILFGASSDAMAQGRGRGGSHFDKKCEKFVNCHDARDGRLDGRGPNRRTGFNNTSDVTADIATATSTVTS